MQKVEPIVSEKTDTETYKNDIELYIKMFCEEYNIDDLVKAPQSQWNACLMYIYEHMFKCNNVLKEKNYIPGGNCIMDSTYNCYNYDMVYDILILYSYYCNVYDKECNYRGFSNLTGIDVELIYTWLKDDYKLSDKGFKIAQKLRNLREDSLSDKLSSGLKNPVGVLAILNRHYAWNMPGVRQESRQAALSADDLPVLEAQNCAGLLNNSVNRGNE